MSEERKEYLVEKTFDVEFDESALKTFNDLIKEKGIRHFKLESDLYGILDVVSYKEYEKLQQKVERLGKENKRLNNIINEIQWKPIDEYFKNKEKYDWVLVKYYDKYNFECIPSVAEYRFDKWYLKDNEKTLQYFEVRYFFDMQQLDKLKQLKEEK